MKILYVDAISAYTAQSNVQGILGAYRALGHEIETFDYRRRAIELGKDGTWDRGPTHWSRRTQLALQRMNHELVDVAKRFHPDFVHLGKCEFVSGVAVSEIKNLTDARIVHLYLDLSEHPKYWVVDIGRSVDWTLLAHQDEVIIQRYLDAGCKHIKFWMPGVDATVYKPCASKNYDLIFMGNYIRCTGLERATLLRKLADAGLSVHVYGRNWRRLGPRVAVHGFVDGGGFAKVTSAAKMALSYNTGRFRMYASWRRILNTMACGTLLLCRYFPGLETVFEDKEHLVWFDNVSEAITLAQYYLADAEAAETIAAQGRDEVLQNHTWAQAIGRLLELR